MSVISWREVNGEEYDEGKDGVREYRKLYRAECSTGWDTPDTVKSYFACPQRWEPYPDDPLARCVSRRATQDKKGGRFWDVECFWTTDLVSDAENPLERPAEIEWSTVEYAIAFPIDLDGKPFTTTTGEPLTDIVVESPGLVADISVAVPEKPDWFRGMVNAVNKGAFAFDGETFAEGELRCKSLACSKHIFEQGFRYRNLRFQLQSRAGGWQKRVLNRGFYELVEREVVDPKTDKKVKKYDRKQIMIDGVPAVEPQLLDRDGKFLELLKEGKLDQEKLAEVVVLDFKVRAEVDYSVFPLKS